MKDVSFKEVNMSTKLTPCGDRLLVEKIPEEKKQNITKGGLVIPGKGRADSFIIGRVIAVGSGTTTPKGEIIPLEFCEGDVVLFSRHMADEYSFGGKDYLIAKSADIMLKIDDYQSVN